MVKNWIFGNECYACEIVFPVGEFEKSTPAHGKARLSRFHLNGYTSEFYP